MSSSVPATPPRSFGTAHILVAEALGTFVLVFFGCGVAVVSQGNLMATAVAFGIAVTVMIHAVGRISGGHFNPAVTVAMALAQRLGWREIPARVLAQLVGALAAGASLWGVLADSRYAHSILGANDYGNGQIGWGGALGLEVLMTATFVLVVLAVTDEDQFTPPMAAVRSLIAPATIGLALTLVHLLGLRLTGTSVNPARSVGVAVFAGGAPLEHVWLFVLAPLVGALAAGLVYPRLLTVPEPADAFGRDSERVAASVVEPTLVPVPVPVVAPVVAPVAAPATAPMPTTRPSAPSAPAALPAAVPAPDGGRRAAMPSDPTFEFPVVSDTRQPAPYVPRRARREEPPA